jgi:dihydroorotase
MPSPSSRRALREAPPVGAPAQILAGRAFLRGKLQPAEIAISEDGWILAVGRSLRGAPRHDVGEAVILPAATDIHVHLREPGGPPGGENLATGTLQAALGGVALVGEMPNTRPPVTSVSELDEKAARVPGRAAVDVLLYGNAGDPRRVAALARHVGAFKLFLSPTTGIPDPPALADVPGILTELARVDLPLSVHAEDPARFSATRPPKDPVGWNAHRPPSAEASALDRLIPPPPALRLHVAHVTTTASVERLRTAGVSFEATPHHLLLSDRSSRTALTKVNPPLRSEGERLRLWEAFARGEVPILASDHAPHPIADKERPFELAPSGVPGVETMLPLLLARVRAADLPLPTLLAAAADRPARWFGQPHGRLVPGHRAHLAVVDFRHRTTVSASRLHAPCGWTPFEGWEAIFPQEVYFRGERVVAAGEFVGAARGSVVRPEFAPSAGTPRPAY